MSSSEIVTTPCRGPLLLLVRPSLYLSLEYLLLLPRSMIITIKVRKKIHNFPGTPVNQTRLESNPRAMPRVGPVDGPKSSGEPAYYISFPRVVYCERITKDCRPSFPSRPLPKYFSCMYRMSANAIIKHTLFIMTLLSDLHFACAQIAEAVGKHRIARRPLETTHY